MYGCRWLAGWSAFQIRICCVIYKCVVSVCIHSEKLGYIGVLIQFARHVLSMCAQCASNVHRSPWQANIRLENLFAYQTNWNIAFPFFRFFVSSLWSPRLHRLILLEGRKSFKLKCPLPATNLEACLFYHQKLARSEIELSGYGSLALAAAGAPVAVPVPRRRQPSWLPLGCRQGLLPYTGA